MRKTLFLCVVTLGAFVVSLTGCATSWKAGVARVDITPEKPLWLSGYSNRDRPADGKETDLWVKALAIEDPAGRRAVLVTLDLIGFDRDIAVDVCERLREEYGLEREQITLCASHTHCSPIVGRNLAHAFFLEAEQWDGLDVYAARLKKDVVTVVGKALGQLSSAELSWGNGSTTFAVNRRENPQDEVPELRAKGELKGPVDHDVPVLRVTAGDKLVAVVAGYACHATVMKYYKVSGDYPGFFQIELEKAHPGVTAMFWAGCGGDQNPLPRRKVGLPQKYGGMLARSVDAVLNGEMRPVDGTLDILYEEVDLPFAELPSKEELERRVEESNRYVARVSRETLDRLARGEEISRTYPYPIQTWRLGPDLCFVALGGEVVVDYALRLKRELGSETTWVAGYSNDVMAYIPSRRVLAEGGYEGASSMMYYGFSTVWAPEVEDIVVRKVHEQVKALRTNDGP